MPNIKSQKDRVAQSKKEAAHNKAIKSNLKTVVKKADAAIDSNAENKDAAIKVAVSALDAAKNKGVIHKNTAARKISRMAKRNTRPLLQIDCMNNAAGFYRSGHFHLYIGSWHIFAGLILVLAFAHQRGQQGKHQTGGNSTRRCAKCRR